MKRAKAPGFGGTVGLLYTFLGFLTSVLVARSFVTLEAHCVQACPVIRVQGIQFHHLYYGMILVTLSLTALAFVEDARTRWDFSLFLGIGSGLVADEVGLLFLGVPYWSSVSLLPVAVGGLLLLTGLALSTLRNGTRDFHILDRSDLLTVASILLAMSGFVYFDRPVRVMVSWLALSAWTLALILLAVHGRKHLMKIRQGTDETHLKV